MKSIPPLQILKPTYESFTLVAKIFGSGNRNDVRQRVKVNIHGAYHQHFNLFNLNHQIIPWYCIETVYNDNLQLTTIGW